MAGEDVSGEPAGVADQHGHPFAVAHKRLGRRPQVPFAERRVLEELPGRREVLRRHLDVAAGLDDERLEKAVALDLDQFAPT
jgi:hypothetical protein